MDFRRDFMSNMFARHEIESFISVVIPTNAYGVLSQYLFFFTPYNFFYFYQIKWNLPAVCDRCGIDFISP